MRKQATHLPVRRGYTLVELTVAMVGASVLMVGLSSTIFIALKATDTSNTPTTATIEVNSALTDMLLELEFALAFSERTANAITFTVPDRDGDSNPETIRYAWSGAPGDPLTRQYNGGAVATLVENVHVFQHDLPTGAANLLSNAAMESGTTNWQAIPGGVINSSNNFSTSPTLSILADRDTLDDKDGGIRQDVTAQIINGSSYDLSAWVIKDQAGGQSTIQLQLRVTSSGDGEQVLFTEQNLTGQSWYKMDATLVPTWTGSLTSAYWQIQSTVGSPRCYYDDVLLGLSSDDHQHVNISLQVGPDARSQLQSGRQLINSPL